MHALKVQAETMETTLVYNMQYAIKLSAGHENLRHNPLLSRARVHKTSV
jgi:hypothetical protein